MNKKFIAVVLLIGLIIFAFMVKQMSEKDKEILFVALEVILMTLK